MVAKYVIDRLLHIPIRCRSQKQAETDEGGELPLTSLSDIFDAKLSPLEQP
ncbi:conserved hypothetical protein [Ricinus communis]|uniref:Uncharacterized protein n=1 Tax=Ricinus communis TaxID=3988 RepID=B9RSM5_RICCO|nr:conserved hypothetical protein [Ricinus communis]